MCLFINCFGVIFENGNSFIRNIADNFEHKWQYKMMFLKRESTIILKFII